MLILFCIYVRSGEQTVFPLHIARWRGNIVSSMFILLGRLAMPHFRGHRATSLMPFLYR